MTIQVITQGRKGDTWGIKFNVQNEGGFSGQVTHIHFPDPGDWDDLVAWAIGAIGLAIPQAAGATFHITGVHLFSKNRDGSFDFFHILGTKRTWWWWLRRPVSFMGFVSDDPLKPAMGMTLMTGMLMPSIIIRSYLIKGLANQFRNRPVP
jgi:hypothetical protein